MIHTYIHTSIWHQVILLWFQGISSLSPSTYHPCKFIYIIQVSSFFISTYVLSLHASCMFRDFFGHFTMWDHPFEAPEMTSVWNDSISETPFVSVLIAWKQMKPEVFFRTVSNYIETLCELIFEEFINVIVYTFMILHFI